MGRQQQAIKTFLFETFDFYPKRTEVGILSPLEK